MPKAVPGELLEGCSASASLGFEAALSAACSSLSIEEAVLVMEESTSALLSMGHLMLK